MAVFAHLSNLEGHDGHVAPPHNACGARLVLDRATVRRRGRASVLLALGVLWLIPAYRRLIVAMAV